MNWTMSLDGGNVKTGVSNGDSNVLASWHGLSASQEHVIALNTIPGSSSTAAFTLERADVTVDTGSS